jgi:hypothetical protein
LSNHVSYTYRTALPPKKSNAPHQKNQGRLSPDAVVKLLDALVAKGGALWLDPQTKQQCLVLWRRVDEWARLIMGWAATYGAAGGSVVLVDDLSRGDDVRGTGASVARLWRRGVVVVFAALSASHHWRCVFVHSAFLFMIVLSPTLYSRPKHPPPPGYYGARGRAQKNNRAARRAPRDPAARTGAAAVAGKSQVRAGRKWFGCVLPPVLQTGMRMLPLAHLPKTPSKTINRTITLPPTHTRNICALQALPRRDARRGGREIFVGRQPEAHAQKQRAASRPPRGSHAPPRWILLDDRS